MADTLTIVRLKPTNKVYIIRVEKFSDSEEVNKRFIKDEYNRHLLQYDQSLQQGGNLHGEEYSGWKETEWGTGGDLIDRQNNVRIFFWADEYSARIVYMLLAPEAVKSDKANKK